MSNCGTLPKQTATITDKDVKQAAQKALTLAREEAKRSCKDEECAQGKCTYIEAKVVGKTVYDPKTRQWTSEQTSSGKCSCVDSETAANPCKKESEQTVYNYSGDPKDAGDRARDLARTLSGLVCKKGGCPTFAGAKKPNECIYMEVTIEGQTWRDSATGQYVSRQTSSGKCRCSVVWL